MSVSLPLAATAVYPPLKVSIVNAVNKVVYVVELPDPRAKFVEIWNDCPYHQSVGCRAVPFGTVADQEGGAA